jgi:hypothetical protein
MWACEKQKKQQPAPLAKGQHVIPNLRQGKQKPGSWCLSQVKEWTESRAGVANSAVSGEKPSIRRPHRRRVQHRRRLHLHRPREGDRDQDERRRPQKDAAVLDNGQRRAGQKRHTD